MKKKIFSLAFVLILIVSLTACGSTAEEMYGDYSAYSLETSCENYASQIVELSSDEAASYIDYYAELAEQDDSYEMYETLMQEWAETQPQVGQFIQFSDFDIAKTGKTVTCTLTMNFTNRDAEMIFVFDKNTMDISAIDAQLVYSLGETMGKAALNTIMGITIVFIILILISLIIYCFRIIPVLQKKFEKKPQVAENVKEPESAAVVVNEKDDLELIAVITAAIAASEGKSTDSFVVRSIKRR